MGEISKLLFGQHFKPLSWICWPFSSSPDGTILPGSVFSIAPALDILGNAVPN